MSITIDSTSARTVAELRRPSRPEPDRIAPDATPRVTPDTHWSISTTVSAGSLSLATTEDLQALSAAVADSADVGLRAARGLMTEIRATLMSAKSGTEKADALGEQLDGLKERLRTTVEASGFEGRNLLVSALGERPAVSSMIASVGSSTSGEVAIEVVDIDTARTTLIAAGDAADGILTRSYAGISRSGAAQDYHLLDVGATVPNRGPSRPIGLSSSTGSDEIGGMIAAVDTMLVGMKSVADEIALGASRMGSSAGLLEALGALDGSGIDGGFDEVAARSAATSVQQMLQAAGLNITNASMARGLRAFI